MGRIRVLVSFIILDSDVARRSDGANGGALLREQESLNETTCPMGIAMEMHATTPGEIRRNGLRTA
ncbi:hypothetical protein GCM10011335_45020 [Aureimonas glaciei]|uniref:Uncharacterized protein n=1 Tax=Aureimonas glaciei TaxID=1776957 RepID=A0A916YAM7_9HYPH|nr:hypothetical protein GCM10011335_45020 [Aureimonas glaciei]